MADIRPDEYSRARGVGLRGFQTKLLGEIALNRFFPLNETGKIRLGKGELAREEQIADLLNRKILKKSKNGLVLGEFGPGHCKWVWGKKGKPDTKKPGMQKKPQRNPKPENKATKRKPRNPETQKRINAIHHRLRPR